MRITAQGLAALADAAIPGRGEVAGLAMADTASGFTCTYTRSTAESTDWSAVTGTAALSSGSVYYLSPSVPGTLTTTPPETAGLALVRIGRAVDTMTLQIMVEPPIYL
ncbi:hypothetical protein [uncultured Thiodictyon sp.]|uniref:hypothetical protein n=1 Tax=uncultured Thiodictyon sp. TaxID=1846217 RepID=UPI0025F4C726|nr:hypothetical protein [uncultured Thiodictyon sp.]